MQSTVNVASVAQSSPFRYPGGKTWLVPTVRRWLQNRSVPTTDFIEPFAGGASVGLAVAFEGLAKHVTLVELDEEVSAVWHTIFEGDFEWLIEQILSFDLTLENVQAYSALGGLTRKEVAFRTILKNRVNYGGILAKGAGVLQYGEGGLGIKSRWYPETLGQRIRSIATLADRVTFVMGDGLAVMRQHAANPTAAFFLDPPYTVGTSGKRAGRHLYTHFQVDHEGLFQIARTIQGDILMTYDNCEGARTLATQHRFQVEPIAMKNNHHANMTELLIGRNLDWIV